MGLLEQILNCLTDEEADKLISDAITCANEKASQVGQLGFLEYGKSNTLFRGFIPLDTRIKYANLAIETYGMETTDFFYEFAHFIRKYKIHSKGNLIYNLESFINSYFGLPGKVDREVIFQNIAWQTTTTDEEFFEALKNNKIGDLKGKGAAACTERSALATQILSLFGTEIYYCIGCVDFDTIQEAHCFNIVKRKNDYALLDYSIPVTSYNQDGSVRAFFPFVGEISNEEFAGFTSSGVLKKFQNYEFINGMERSNLDSQRTYVVGAYKIEKENSVGVKK